MQVPTNREIKKGGINKVVRKLTLGFKKKTCQYCKQCDIRAMRQGRNYCSKTYRPSNGHCINFESIKPKRKPNIEGGIDSESNRGNHNPYL